MAKDCPFPPKVYCNYFKVEDHIIEECPKLIAKWKAKVPQNNNVLKISAKDREDQPTVAIITRSGIDTNEYAATPRNVPIVEVRKAQGPKPPFDTQKEIDTFMEARREFATNDAEAYTSKRCGDLRHNRDGGMVLGMPQEVPETTMTQKNVSYVMLFLKTMLGLLKNEDNVFELSEIIVTYEKLNEVTVTKESSPIVNKESTENIYE